MDSVVIRSDKGHLGGWVIPYGTRCVQEESKLERLQCASPKKENLVIFMTAAHQTADHPYLSAKASASK